MDGAVNMRFCRKVHYGIYLLILQEVLYKVIIPDIPMHEKKAGMTFQEFKISPVARIGQGIKHHHPVFRIVFNPVVDEVCTDKPGTASYKE